MAFLEEESKKPDAAESEEVGPAADSQKKKKRAKRKNRLKDSLRALPTIERTIVAPEVEENPELFRLLDEEVSERLHFDPATFTLEVIKRQVHVRKDDPDAVPITPPLEPCLLPGSVLTPNLGAHLLTEKFCYHQPFYRQEWRLRAAHGIELTRNNMCNWHDHLAGLLSPLYDLMAERYRSSDYLRVDETPIKCLVPGAGKTELGQFWVYYHPEYGPLFDWHKSRSNYCLDNILIDEEGNASFNGYLQSDGLRAYQTFIERHDQLAITPVSCLAHIRRKFVEAKNDFPRISSWILLQIAKIYAIERKLKQNRAGPQERLRHRWLLTRRHYKHLKKLLDRLHQTASRRGILPQSDLGKALSYAVDQWSHLEPCFEDGRIEFDNNHTEGAIRPTKLGVKNWMFIGGEETGWRSAVIYTFVEQVRRHCLDPYAYFKWVFEKLMHNPPVDELEGLLPTAWVELQKQALADTESMAA